MGVKLVLSSVHKDFSTCTAFAGVFTGIVWVFISCRLYAKLYGSTEAPGGNSEVQERVRKHIPDMYVDILRFTYRVCKYLRSAKLSMYYPLILRAMRD